MTCEFPPELDDYRILTYLDGEAGSGVADHLKVCPHCRAKAARLQRMEGYLAAAAYRRSCPTPDELGEYQLGLLKRKRAAGITAHLEVDRCPHCAREMAQLRSFLGELAPASEPSLLKGAVEQVRVVVAGLLGGAPGPFPALQPAPAAAGLRGDNAATRIFAAEEVEIIVGVQSDTEAPDRLVLLGLITGVDSVGYSVHVWQDGRLIAAAPVDEGGNFIVSDLIPAGYELVLSGPGREIYIEELKI